LHAAEWMNDRVVESSTLDNSDGEVSSLVECYVVFGQVDPLKHWALQVHFRKQHHTLMPRTLF